MKSAFGGFADRTQQLRQQVACFCLALPGAIAQMPYPGMGPASLASPAANVGAPEFSDESLGMKVYALAQNEWDRDWAIDALRVLGNEGEFMRRTVFAMPEADAVKFINGLIKNAVRPTFFSGNEQSVADKVKRLLKSPGAKSVLGITDPIPVSKWMKLVMISVPVVLLVSHVFSYAWNTTLLGFAAGEGNNQTWAGFMSTGSTYSALGSLPSMIAQGGRISLDILSVQQELQRLASLPTEGNWLWFQDWWWADLTEGGRGGFVPARYMF